MINLLPPDYKDQIKYSRYNIVVVRYVALVFGVAIAMSAILFGSSIVAKHRITDLDEQIAQQQQLITEFDSVINEAKSLNASIEKAGDVIQNESNFVAFLEELEGVIPTFAFIRSMNLTHSAQTSGADAPDEHLLQLIMQVGEQDQVPDLQKTLENMQRVKTVDVQSAQRIEDSSIQVDMVIKLTARPGEVLQEEVMQ